MNRLARIMVKVAAVIALMGLTLGATGNPDPGRTGPANDGGTSGPSGGESNGSGSGSGCSK